MSIFNAISTTTPYNGNDEVLRLYLDAESDAYVLKNVITLIGKYTFSIWYKSEKESTITFNLFGDIEQVSSTTYWQKYKKTVNVSSLENVNINVIPALNTNAYFYEGFLSEGTLDNSWIPAPEDVSDEIGSRIEQTANAINLRVSDTEGRIGKLETSSEEIGLELKNARGKSSSLAIRIGEIESKVVDENGQSIIEQTSEKIMLSVEDRVKKIYGSGRNLIRNSKTLLFNKYYLTNTSQITTVLTEDGVLIAAAENIDNEGVLIFNKSPSLNEEGILIF